MSELNRLWTKIARFFEALEGMDDPIGDYMFSLGKRVERIERNLDYLKGNCIRTPAAVQFRIMPTAEDIPCR
jgi:hypothetical protein